MLSHSNPARVGAVAIASLLLLATAPLGLATSIPVPTSNDYAIRAIDGAPLPLSANATTLALADNEVTSAFDLGFTTSFFQQSTNLFWVGSNGFVTLHFQTGPGCCDGQPMPTPGDPDGIIAGFWTDLNPAAGGSIAFDHQTLNGTPALVVGYSNVPVVGGGSASFQIVILRTGEFQIRVSNATANPTHFATIGAENINGTRGVQVFRDGNGTSVVNQGFDFQPIFPPTPPPTISFVSPSTASRGQTVFVVGANFLPGAQVQLDDRFVSSSFLNSGELDFQVPFDEPLGVANVTVANPDGNSTKAVGILTVVDPFFLSSVSPFQAPQGTLVEAFGSGFGPSTSLLVGGSAVSILARSPSVLLARIPTTFAPGTYDVSAADPVRGVTTLFRGILVEGRPDVVLAALDATRDRVGTTAAPGVGVDVPGPWRVHVRVENRGDAVAANVQGFVVLAPSAGAASSLDQPPQRVSFFAGDLDAGQGRDIDVLLGSGTQLGDFELTAAAFDHGLPDRDLTNNDLSREISAYVSGTRALGVGGIDPDSCSAFLDPVVAIRQCEPPETVHHDVEKRAQSDVHSGARMRLDATMKTAQFDFNHPALIFSSQGTSNEGFSEACTTWRFEGDPAGTMMVAMASGNGLDGAVSFAGDRSSSNGTLARESWNETRAFGIDLAEDAHVVTPTGPSGALATYAFSTSPAASWTLHASGLTGDFTRCTLFDGSGTFERFTYAQLPADASAETPSFDGAGQAANATVDFQGSIDDATVTPLLGGI